jgi:hypothetical protein
MLTCTPVMSGRNSEDKPSPFMAPRPFVFPSDLKAQEESKGSRTPTTSSNNDQKVKLNTPFDEYFKKLSAKPEIPVQTKEKEEDFKTDMDEMSNLDAVKFPLKTFKIVSSKGLPVTPGSEKKSFTGFSYLKQNTVATTSVHPKIIDDNEINPSSTIVPNPITSQKAAPVTINPFMNPFFANKDLKEEENKDKDSILNCLKK